MSSTFLQQGSYARDDDYYVILDVDFNASQEAITSSYRNLARRFHPDKHNQDERSRREAEVIFEKIRKAYEVLGDQHKRQIYDTLGPEGLKYDGWKLVKKQMTADDIRDEYMRIQKQQQETRLNVIAKPRASFTIGINASELFTKPNQEDSFQDDDLASLSTIETLVEKIASIEISAMSANMSVESNPSPNHTTTLSGNLTASNGTGNGAISTKYKYKHSPSKNFDISYDFGNGPIFTVGYFHKLNAKTSLNARGYLVFGDFEVIPGAKLTLVHKIRDYLIGKVSYKEGISSPTVTTSLIYINQRLMLEVTSSYKLSRTDQVASVDIGYRFNNGSSRLNVALVASSQGNLAVQYGCDTTVLQINSVGAAVAFSVPSGVTLKLRFSRANQELNIPIYLSDELYSAPIFYGTMLPLVAYYLLDRCYLRQYKQLHL